MTNCESCSLQPQARELLKRNWQQYARLWRSYTAARMLITVSGCRLVPAGGGCGLVTAAFAIRPRVCPCASGTAAEEYPALLMRLSASLSMPCSPLSATRFATPCQQIVIAFFFGTVLKGGASGAHA